MTLFDKLDQLLQGKPAPVIFFDFDGVINVDSATDKVRKPDVFKPNRKEPLYIQKETWGGWGSYTGEWHLLQWSEQLIQQLTELKEETGYYWVWLTTWTQHTRKLDGLLKTPSDLTIEWEGVTPSHRYNDPLSRRNQQKLETVKLFKETHPDVPTVWVDDEATILHKANTPNLLTVTPNPVSGLQDEHVEVMRDFLRTFI